MRLQRTESGAGGAGAGAQTRRRGAARRAQQGARVPGCVSRRGGGSGEVVGEGVRLEPGRGWFS